MCRPPNHPHGVPVVAGAEVVMQRMPIDPEDWQVADLALRSQRETITVKDCPEQRGMLMLKERTLCVQLKDVCGTFIDSTGVSRGIMAGGIEDPVWFSGMIAKSGGPPLCDRVRAAEQARVGTNAGQSS